MEEEPPQFNVEEIVDAVSAQVKRQLDAHDKAQRSVLNEASLAFEVEGNAFQCRGLLARLKEGPRRPLLS